MTRLSPETVQAKIKEWNINGLLDGLQRFDAFRTGQLIENQKTQLDKNDSSYNLAICKAIYQALGRNSLFSHVVSHHPLQEADGKVYYLVVRPDPKDESSPNLVIESEQVELNDIPLNISFKDTESFCNDIEWKVDQLIISDIKDHIKFTNDWDYKETTGGKDAVKSLYEKLVETSNQVGKAIIENDGRLWSAANWIITHPYIPYNFFESSHNWKPIKPEHEARRIQYFGTVHTRWRIYSSWSMPEDEILMGYRGDSYMDACLIYTNYIPFKGTAENTTLTMGKKVTPSARYAKIKLHNLPDND